MIFNDYDFKDDLIVEEIVRSVMPNVINTSKYIPGKNGSVFNRSTFGDTYIIVKCRLIQKSRMDVQKVMRKIAGKLYTEEPAKLALRDEPDKHNFAIVDGMTEVEKFLHTGYFEIMFICHDPFAYTDEISKKVNSPFNNLGTFPAKGIIEITATKGNEIVAHAGDFTNPNLIKSDFSDFTAYEGAVVTRNKTFPIGVFKGGRNLLLDSKGTIDLTTLTWEQFENETWKEIGE